MKKKTNRPLRLQRETLNQLGMPTWLDLVEVRGAVTSPPLNTSGACEVQSAACGTGQG